MNAIKDNHSVTARQLADLNKHAQSGGRKDRTIQNIQQNEERLPLTHEMVNNAVAFPNTHFNVPLELVKIFFRIDQMKVVPGIRALDHHHKKIATIIEVTIAHRRLKFFAILLDPLLEIDRRLHWGRAPFNR